MIVHLCIITLTSLFFFFNDTATTEIYTLSLHDALPISHEKPARTGSDTEQAAEDVERGIVDTERRGVPNDVPGRSEEHTSELQSRRDLVCRLLLEKKKKKTTKL